MPSVQNAMQRTALSSNYSHFERRPNVINRLFKKLFEIYCRVLFAVYCPLKVTGRQNLPKTAFIICSNHCSHLDSGVLMLASGLAFHHCGMIAAKEYFFENKLRKFFLNLLMNLIPIDRKITRNELIQSLAACTSFMKNGGRNIIFYPEGTRSLTGKMQAFKNGPALFATELCLPVVPAYIDGTFGAWPKGRVWMKPNRIHAIIGKPIDPQKYIAANQGKPKKHIYRIVAQELEQRVRELKESLSLQKHDAELCERRLQQN